MIICSGRMAEEKDEVDRSLNKAFPMASKASKQAKELGLSEANDSIEFLDPAAVIILIARGKDTKMQELKADKKLQKEAGCCRVVATEPSETNMISETHYSPNPEVRPTSF